MEYTEKENQLLSMLNRTDFKNLSKNDLATITSKMADLRPEVAHEMLEHFPKLADLIKDGVAEYSSILKDVLHNESESSSQVYSILQTEQSDMTASRESFRELAEKVLDGAKVVLENENTDPQTAASIFNSEVEILKLVKEQDAEVREQERKISKDAEEKDEKKMEFYSKLITATSFVIVGLIDVGVTAFTNGDFHFKIPRKS